MVGKGPDALAEAVRSAVQRVLVAGLPFERMGDAIEHEAAAGDAVGESSRNSAEMGRVRNIVLDRVEAQGDALRPAGGRDDQIAHHCAVGQDLGFGAGLRLDDGLIDGSAVDLPEQAFASRSLSLLRPAEANSADQAGASSARIASNTSRNIDSVSAPVLVL